MKTWMTWKRRAGWIRVVVLTAALAGATTGATPDATTATGAASTTDVAGPAEFVVLASSSIYGELVPCG